MTLGFRRYFWTINLLTIGLCAMLAAKGVGQLVMAQVPPVRVARAAPRGPLGQTSVLPEKRDISEVLSRNIFCSECEPAEAPEPVAGAAGEAPGPAAAGGPVKTSLELELIATLVSDKDPAWSYAALRDTSEERALILPVGASVPGGATIAEIAERRILLHNGSRVEFLDLAEDGAGRPAPRKPRTVRRTKSKRKAMKGMEEVSKGIRKVGANKWEIERRALNKVLANTHMIARSARIVPAVRNGKPAGFKLYAIRPGSLYNLLGMRSGDTINAINGHPITTPDKALEIYTKLRSASHVTISFKRRGKPKTHEYTIR